MATNVRGHMGTRSMSGRGSQYNTQTGYGNWSGSNASDTTGSKASGGTNVPPKYKSCCNSFEGKISSYKTLFNQTKGPAKYGRPTPATLNTFANWINKGAVIQTVTTAQVARWAKMARKQFNTRTPTPTSCKTVLWAKFGKNAIKAVARTKTGSFMVATTPTVKGKNFCFPK